MKKGTLLFWLFFLMASAIYVQLLRYYIRMFYVGTVSLLLLYLATNYGRWFSTKFFALSLSSVMCYSTSLLVTGRLHIDTMTHITVPFFLAPFVYAGMLASVVSYGDRKALKFSVYGAMIPTLYTIVKTLMAPPDSSRVFFGNTRGDYDMTMKAMDNVIQGVMGYDAIHGLPFLMIGFMFVAQNVRQRQYKWLAWTMAFLCAATVFRSGYGACSVTTVVVFALCFVSPRRRESVVMWVLMASLAFVFALKTGLLLKVLLWLKPCLPDGGNLFYKIEEVEMLLLDVDGSEYWNVRSELYDMSWRGFLHHPVFGGADGGGHSYVLDTFGSVGLFGAIPHLALYFSLFSYIKGILPKNAHWHYMVSGVILLVLLTFKSSGLFAQNLILYYILPALLVWREDMFNQASMAARGMLKINNNCH